VTICCHIKHTPGLTAVPAQQLPELSGSWASSFDRPVARGGRYIHKGIRESTQHHFHPRLAPAPALKQHANTNSPAPDQQRNHPRTQPRATAARSHVVQQVPGGPHVLPAGACARHELLHAAPQAVASHLLPASSRVLWGWHAGGAARTRATAAQPHQHAAAAPPRAHASGSARTPVVCQAATAAVRVSRPRTLARGRACGNQLPPTCLPTRQHTHTHTHARTHTHTHTHTHTQTPHR
jgi:hypothetical protein